MNHSLLSGLNAAQKQAVLTTEGPLLILAGAGSGKTKTLTTRLAYLIETIGIPPQNTLTLTFTNKAAQEMQKRALSLMQHNTHPPLLCTFHKFGLLFLHFHIHHLNRKANFIVIDRDDQKKILKSLHHSASQPIPPPLLISEISRMKNSLLSPIDALNIAKQETYRQIAKIYAQYQESLLANNMVDFDDLLTLSLEILNTHEEIATLYSNQYQYIMVDEYQDTNDLQYQLLQKLCCAHDNLCVVGDDDQSIYSWRGANIQNILQFSKHFAHAKTITLEQNYRSTPNILEAANKLISHNQERLGKILQSTLKKGKDIELIQAKDEKEEVHLISQKIKALLNNGIQPSQIAVLFRINALSRNLEEGFTKERIPFMLVGMIRFYERAEIKDILSYFRVLVNLDDDFSLLRIINTPKRGIGKTSIHKLIQLKNTQNQSINALFNNKDQQAFIKKALGGRIYQLIFDLFTKLIHLQQIAKEHPSMLLDAFEEQIGLCEALNAHPEADKISNIEEFYALFREFLIQNPSAHLEDFLNELALRSDQEDLETRKQTSAIACMSVHSSKGLEFDYLFILGLEEGFFPLLKENTPIQEERRLGYVALTRAKKELVLSYVASRFFKGDRTTLSPSRFLSESGLLCHKSTPNKSHFQTNDCIFHPIFGAGRILSITKEHNQTKLKINFGGLIREILSQYVKPL